MYKVTLSPELIKKVPLLSRAFVKRHGNKAIGFSDFQKYVGLGAIGQGCFVACLISKYVGTLRKVASLLTS